MNANHLGEKCPACAAPEVPATTPRTVYACGSSDYDQRPGSFVSKCSYPLDNNAQWLDQWAQSDSCLKLDRGLLRAKLAEDVALTGTALMTEQECMEMIVGPMSDDRERPCSDDHIPLDLIARFPSTHAWLNAQWTS
jgi:hypothetical protein